MNQDQITELSKGEFASALGAEEPGDESVSCGDLSCSTRQNLDRRIERTRQIVLETAKDLFDSGGWDAVTHLAVSEKSGIGRSTLYRHWPDTVSLLRDTVLEYSKIGEVPHTGDVESDLFQELRFFALHLQDPSCERSIVTILERAAFDRQFSDLRQRLTADFVKPIADTLADGVRLGKFRESLNIDTAVAMLTGPLLYQAFFARQPLSDEFVSTTVHAFLKCHLAAGA